MTDVGGPEEWRSLDSYETRTKAFVVRAWVEPRERDGDRVIWRGLIEAVAGPSDSQEPSTGPPARQVFTRLDDMVDFMIGHLKQIGIPEERLGPAGRTRGRPTGQNSE